MLMKPTKKMNKLVKLLVSSKLSGYLKNQVAALITCNQQEKNFFNLALVDMYIIEADRTEGTFNTNICMHI